MTKNFTKDQNQEIDPKGISNSKLLESSTNTNIPIDDKDHFSKAKTEITAKTNLKSSRKVFASETDTHLESKTSLLEKAAEKVKETIKLGKSSSGSIVTKNRIFILIPKPFVTLSNEEKQIITKFPTEYAKFLQTGKNLCHNDMNFCYELLKPTKKSFYKFFNDNGLFFPKITEETTEYPSLCYRFLQNHAHKHLLESFYNDGRFREVFTKAAEYFQRISDNPFFIGRFKGTSNIYIMKTFIIGEKTIMDLLSQEDESSNNNWQITFNTKIIVINSIYFAFRHRIIKNYWFLLLSHYIKNNDLVSEKELTRFLLNNEISNGLARKLYKELLFDVRRVFRGWKGAKPTWQQFLNELRFFRKKLCNELPDLEIQKFTEETQTHNPEIFQEIIGEILDQEKTLSNLENSDSELSSYFVDQFISYCKNKSKDQFKIMFNKYYMGETKNNKKINAKKYKNYNLFQEFLAEITSNYLKQKNLSVDQNSKAKKLWRKMIDNKTGKHYIHEVLDNSKTLWLDLMEKVDLKQLTSERIKIWLKRFNEEFNLEKNRNYSTTGDLFNDIEKITTDKLKMRVVIQKKIEFNSKNPSNVKNNLKFFQNRRVISSMIPTSSNQSISNLEKELFDKILSATPYKDKTENYYQKDDILQEDRILNSIPIQQIIPCFESYIRSDLDRKIEKIMRKRFVSINSCIIKQKVKVIKYPMPIFRNLNFSTGPASNHLFEMDLENRIFKLCLFKRAYRKGIWYDFIIQDEDTAEELRITRKKKKIEKKFYNLELEDYPFNNNKTKKNKKTKKCYSRLSKFSNIADENGVSWKARNPTVVYDLKKQDFMLNIPFEKVINDLKTFKKNLKQNTIIPQNKAIDEIVIGIDQGISWYAVISVDLIKSKYRKTKEGKILREIIARKHLRHYYLNDLEVFGISFNKTTGLFNNGESDNSGRFIKRKTNNLWGKRKFRVLRRKIRTRQKKLMVQREINEQNIIIEPSSNQSSTHPYSNDAILSNYWNKFHRLQKTLAANLAAKVRDIAVYYQTIFKNENPSFRNCPIRVQVEYLKWVNQKPKYKTGYFLSHNNIHFIFSQFQESLKKLLIDHGIGLWTVSPRYTSKICSLCHYHENGTRYGRNFHCSNPNHKLKSGKSYSCNADLNASRNISQFPPLNLKACNTT